MDWSRAKANRVCQENTLVIANTLFQQHKRRLYAWTSPDGQHWNQINYILCSQRWRSSIQSAKTRLGADCGSDHDLLIAKFRLKLKKVGETSRPFRYDLNQIPYAYTEEVTNRFKEADLIRVLGEIWMEFCNIVQEVVTKIILKKKKCKKKRRKPKGKVQKERYTHLNAECQKIARRDKKAIISDQCKEIENSNRMGRLKISSRKLEITRENFLQRWAQ